MKIAFVMAIMLSSFQTFAEALPEVGKKSQYYYFELKATEKFVFTLSTARKCKDNQEEIKVEDIEAVKFYYSDAAEKRIPIRIKSLYADYGSTCTGSTGLTTEKQIVIGPFTKKLTHIRFTVTDGISLKKASDCGVAPEGKYFNDYCTLILK